MSSALTKIEGDGIQIRMNYEMPTTSNYRKLLNFIKVEFDLYQQECFEENLTILFPQVLCEIKRSKNHEKVVADVSLRGTARRECLDIAEKISKVYKFFLQIL